LEELPMDSEEVVDGAEEVVEKVDGAEGEEGAEEQVDGTVASEPPQMPMSVENYEAEDGTVPSKDKYGDNTPWKKRKLERKGIWITTSQLKGHPALTTADLSQRRTHVCTREGCWRLINMGYDGKQKLLVTTVTEVSPPFRGVPQIWRSRSGYKTIAVSFCDQLVCSRLLATQTRTSAGARRDLPADFEILPNLGPLLEKNFQVCVVKCCKNEQ
jgi:hypothetical protein